MSKCQMNPDNPHVPRMYTTVKQPESLLRCPSEPEHAHPQLCCLDRSVDRQEGGFTAACVGYSAQSEKQ